MCLLYSLFEFTLTVFDMYRKLHVLLNYSNLFLYLSFLVVLFSHVSFFSTQSSIKLTQSRSSKLDLLLPAQDFYSLFYS